MTIGWIVGIALWWFLVTAALDLILGGDIKQRYMLVIWVFWPILLPIFGVVYIYHVIRRW